MMGMIGSRMLDAIQTITGILQFHFHNAATIEF